MFVQIEDVVSKLRKNWKEYGIILYPATTNNDIADFEKKRKLNLPEDLKIFYRFCNGFESAEDMFRIIPLHEILDFETTSPDKPNQIGIAEYMIYCDVWSVEINTAGKNMYTIFNGTSPKRKTMTNSFAEFLERFLANGVFGEGGLYTWHDEIDKAN